MSENTNNAESAMLEALERDFQQVLVEMTGDQSIERFRKQFQKLYDGLKKSHENERILLQRSKELKTQISRSQGMIKSAIGLNQNDATKINILTAELENSKNVIAQMKEKEEKSKATIEYLKGLNDNLEKVIKESESAQSGNTSKINELISQTTQLTRECEDLEKAVETLAEDKFRYTEEQKNIMNTQLNLETEIKKEESLKRDTLNRLEKDQRRAEEHEREAKKMMADIEDIRKEREAEIKEIDTLKEKLEELKGEDEEMKLDIERIKEDKIKHEQESEKLKSTILELKRTNNDLKYQREQRDNLIKKKNGESNDEKIKLDLLTRNKDKKIAEIQRTINEKDELSKTHVGLINLVYRLY